MSHVHGTGSGDSNANIELLIQVLIELLTPKEGEGSTTRHAAPPEPPPAPPVDPAVAAQEKAAADAEAAAAVQTNIDAQQAIRAAFLRVARDNGGVGDEREERKVQQALFNKLSQIDFSQPGGDKYLREIIGFISRMGKDITKDEVKYLRELLNTAATTLPPPPPAPPPVTDPPVADPPGGEGEGGDPTEELLTLLTRVLADGEIDETERAELLEKLSELAARIDEGDSTEEAPPAEDDPACCCTSPAEEAPPAEDTEGNSDEIFAGVLRLLSDLLRADEDGVIDSEERAELLKDAMDLMQKLHDDGGGTDGSGGNTGGTDPDGGMTTRSGNHDSLWFLDQSGLTRLLRSLDFGEGSDIARMVEEMLGDNTEAQGRGSLST